MTQKQIRKMFTVGSRWHATRTGPGKHRDEVRTVAETRSQYLVFEVPGCPAYFTDWPKAREVLEARDGFLRFSYEDCNGVEVTLQRVEDSR